MMGHAVKWALLAAALAACHEPPSPGAVPALVEPADFATWPRVTEKPVQVDAQLAAMCAALPVGGPRAGRAARGPHADHSIVVRVSPDGIAAYREGRPLPTGAVVVKEKYDDASASGPLRAYGVMIKRQAGYDPRGGDWEYGFVTLGAERVATRGRLEGCAGCHGRARDTDHLFRSYRGAGQ